jgi:tRNA(His) 5'-end guanylyltransferase
MSVSEKNELLFSNGINFNDLPSWQKRGTGLVWEDYLKSAVNRATGEKTEARRRRLAVIYDLPMKEDYGAFIKNILATAAD